MADPEAPEPDVLEELLPALGDTSDDEDEPILALPADVSEADALDQARQPAIPRADHLPHLRDDPEVPEADALEQAETFASTEDDDERR